jgi:hypothetical protein
MPLKVTELWLRVDLDLQIKWPYDIMLGCLPEDIVILIVDKLPVIHILRSFRLVSLSLPTYVLRTY